MPPRTPVKRFLKLPRRLQKRATREGAGLGFIVPDGPGGTVVNLHFGLANRQAFDELSLAALECTDSSTRRDDVPRGKVV